MSGIAGICNVNGIAVDPATLHRMTRSIVHRGPDGVGHWFGRNVALGHVMLCTTPEALHEEQPLCSEDGTLCLSVDGRVDNREELKAVLTGKGFEPRSDTDADIFLRAYQCWGEDCARHIIGDFTLAIWDERHRKLFCARDFMGSRPFYYVFDGKVLAFCSELRPLIERSGFERRPNLGMVGEFLCGEIASKDETLFENVLRLPAAHHLVLQDGKLRLTRYFDFDPALSIRYRTDAEYADHFFEIFREAVKCRMRSVEPIALLLSGGLDSCSILGMAGALEREGAISSSQLVSYNVAFDHPEGNEDVYVDDAVAKWNFEFHRFRGEHLAEEPLQENILWHLDFPETSIWQHLQAIAKGNGSRVILNGDGGDEWLAGDTAHCADLLRSLRIPALARQFRSDVEQIRIWGHIADPRVTSMFWQWSVLPLIPAALKAAVRRFLPRQPPSWISREFASSINLQQRMARKRSGLRYASIAQQKIHELLDWGSLSLGFDLCGRDDGRLGMERRQPFNDRRLIEFALAIPEEQRWRGDMTKFVLRQAMREYLPHRIVQRRSKADFTFGIADSVTREIAGKDPASFNLAKAGFIDAKEVGNLQRRWSGGEVDLSWRLWMILALEQWFDTVFSAPSGRFAQSVIRE